MKKLTIALVIIALGVFACGRSRNDLSPVGMSTGGQEVAVAKPELKSGLYAGKISIPHVAVEGEEANALDPETFDLSLTFAQKETVNEDGTKSQSWEISEHMLSFGDEKVDNSNSTVQIAALNLETGEVRIEIERVEKSNIPLFGSDTKTLYVLEGKLEDSMMKGNYFEYDASKEEKQQLKQGTFEVKIEVKPVAESEDTAKIEAPAEETPAEVK